MSNLYRQNLIFFITLTQVELIFISKARREDVVRGKTLQVIFKSCCLVFRLHNNWCKFRNDRSHLKNPLNVFDHPHCEEINDLKETQHAHPQAQCK